MKDTLIMGSEGRMGRRYAAILHSLGVDFDGCDVRQSKRMPDMGAYDYVILATPTETHYGLMKKAIDSCANNVLCEKPFCMDVDLTEEIASLADYTRISVVCNWAYVLPWRLDPGQHLIQYQNWYTGPGNDTPEGRVWDCCQLYYLSPKVPIITHGPEFRAYVDEHAISLTDIDRSYIAMIKDWRCDVRGLWDTTDALEMERKCTEAIQCIRS